MKGKIIAEEFNKIVWVNDKDGAEYACYSNTQNDTSRKEDLSNEDQSRCVNLNAVIGDSW